MVARVQSHELRQLSQPLFNIFQNFGNRLDIVDAVRCDSHTHHNIVLAVYCTMLAEMESIRLAFLVRLSAFRVAFAPLNLPGWPTVIIILPVKWFCSDCFLYIIFDIHVLISLNKDR